MAKARARAQASTDPPVKFVNLYWTGKEIQSRTAHPTEAAARAAADRNDLWLGVLKITTTAELLK